MKLKDLSKIYYLKKEIEYLKNRLYLLSKYPNSSGSKTKASKGIAPLVITAEAEIELHIEIENRLKELIETEKEITGFISSIDDPQVRLIFYKRHIELKTWTKAAIEIGGGNTSDGVRMMYNRYIEKHPEMFDE